MAEPHDHKFSTLTGICVVCGATEEFVRDSRDGLPPNVVKLAGVVPLSGELLADAQMFDRALDRVLRPWRYPDRNPMPTLVLFPRLERLRLWWTRTLHRVAAHQDDWADEED